MVARGWIRRRRTRVVSLLLGPLALTLGLMGCDRESAPVRDAAPIGFDAEVEAVAEDGKARVDVTLTGARDAASYEVVAIVEQRSSELAEVSSGVAGERHFTGLLEVPTGEFVPIDVIIDGPDRATLTTGVMLDEPGASIDRIVDDRVIDTAGDGEPDTWRIGILVEVVEPGSYRLNVDLADGDGTRLMSATGTGQLDPGPGLIEIEVPVEVVETLDVAGPLEVVDATLSRGNGAPNRAASKSNVGTVSAPRW